MKNIVIGVSSSIACFKVVELVKGLKKDFEIDIILTEKTTELIDKKEFEKVLGKKVAIGLFRKGFDYKKYLDERDKIKHMSLAEKADIFLVCPATANIMGKIANGIADDLLTTSIMATNAIRVICPAMNANMWNNTAVQENVSKLKKIGYHFIGPSCGKLACGTKGEGRLVEVGKIYEEVKDIIKDSSKLKGKKILVTAGGTTEEIDPVRVITNKSSGKMGIYLAEEASKMGADVTLIRGRTDIEPTGKIKDIRADSVDELFHSIKKEIKDKDIIVHAAAVSDFKADRPDKKIKSDKNLSLGLKPTIKIIDHIKGLNKKVFLVGFKAEHGVSEKELVERAYHKLKESKCDLMVANDVSKSVFGSEDNEAYIVDKDKKTEHIKRMSKRDIARRILEIIR